MRAKTVKDEMTELTRDLLIVQLGLAGVPQQDIRSVARCDIRRVNRIVRLLKDKVARGRAS
jgi:hypothetical protein